MKIQTPYLYVAGIVLIIISLFIFTQIEKGNSSEKKITNNEMPDDEIHRNLKNQHGQMGVTEETKKTIENFEKALEENPNDTSKIREYADFLAMAHQIDKAQSLYEKILNIDKKRSDILLSLSTIFYNKGKLDKAAELTNEILKLNRNDYTAIYNLGVIEATRNNFDLAKKHWEKVIKESKDQNITTAAKSALDRLNQMEKK